MPDDSSERCYISEKELRSASLDGSSGRSLCFGRIGGDIMTSIEESSQHDDLLGHLGSDRDDSSSDDSNSGSDDSSNSDSASEEMSKETASTLTVGKQLLPIFDATLPATPVKPTATEPTKKRASHHHHHHSDSSSPKFPEFILDELSVVMNKGGSSGDSATPGTAASTTSLSTPHSPVSKSLTTLADYIQKEKFDGYYDDLTRNELLIKLENLSLRLEQLTFEIDHEKSAHRKKEECLGALRVELNRRTKEIADKNCQILKLSETVRSLENKIRQKEIELEHQIDRSKRMERSHRKQMLETQQNYRKYCREYNSRIASIEKVHRVKTHELKQSLDDATSEKSRLRNKLSKVEKQALRDKEKSRKALLAAKAKYNNSRGNILLNDIKIMVRVVATVFMIVLVVYVVADHYNLLSMDAVCAPIMPGTHLHTVAAEGCLDAPWWAPEDMKETAFHTICNPRDRTRISWVTDSWGSTQISLLKFDDGHSTRPQLVQSMRADKHAEIFSDFILLTNKKLFGSGNFNQKVKALWSMAE